MRSFASLDELEEGRRGATVDKRHPSPSSRCESWVRGARAPRQPCCAADVCADRCRREGSFGFSQHLVLARLGRVFFVY